MKRTLLLALLISFACRPLHPQAFEITPNRVLLDEAVTIRATGLQANERITIQADLVDGAGEPWTSKATFLADAAGVVDLTRQAPVKGSYKEQSAMGLIWSMTPTSKHVRAYQRPTQLRPQSILFRLTRDSHPDLTGEMVQLAVADGVRQLEIKGVLHGTLFLPAASEPSPAVLVLGGSEGGSPRPRAAWLASHGYVTLALAYFHEEGLPQELAGIPLEYFGQALHWMAQRQEVQPGHIGVLGVSRGAELALQLSSMYPDIGAVVAFAPANVRYPACCGSTPFPYAWTWKGMPLAYALPRSVPTMRAVIPAERAHGPILLIAGKDDGVWPSAAMADQVLSRLRRENFLYRVEELKYDHAGHTAGRPGIQPEWQGVTRHPISGLAVEMGGTPAGNSRSSLDAAPKVLTFLKETLSMRADEQVGNAKQ